MVNENVPFLKQSYIFIYLFIIREPTPATGWLARVNAKERQVKRAKKNKKGAGAQMAKLLTSTRAIVALIADEEQDKNRKKNKKKEIGSRPPAQLPWTIRSPPTNRRDHTVSLFF